MIREYNKYTTEVVKKLPVRFSVYTSGRRLRGELRSLFGAKFHLFFQIPRLANFNLRYRLLPALLHVRLRPATPLKAMGPAHRPRPVGHPARAQT